MHEREAYYHEQQDPIEGETDREPEDREAAAHIHFGFRIQLNTPLVASASVGCDGRAFVPMRRKIRVAPVTIPRPAMKAMAPTTIRPRNGTWTSRPSGIKKWRITPTIRTESGISGGKMNDVWRIAGCIGHGTCVALGVISVRPTSTTSTLPFERRGN